MKKTSLKKRLIYNNIYYYLMVSLSVLLILPLFFILFFIVKKGIGVLNWDFFTQLQGVTANIRPPIFRKKIENYKKYANFKGEIRFPCEIQL